jgi:hypothetical protein
MYDYSILQFLIKNKNEKFSAVEFFKFLVIKNIKTQGPEPQLEKMPDPDQH